MVAFRNDGETWIRKETGGNIKSHFEVFITLLFQLFHIFEDFYNNDMRKNCCFENAVAYHHNGINGSNISIT